MGIIIIRLIEAKKQKVKTADFPSGQKLEEYVQKLTGKPDRLRLFEIEEGRETKVTEFTTYKELGKYASSLNGDDSQITKPKAILRSKKKKLLTNKLQEKVVENQQGSSPDNDSDPIKPKTTSQSNKKKLIENKLQEKVKDVEKPIDEDGSGNNNGENSDKKKSFWDKLK